MPVVDRLCHAPCLSELGDIGFEGAARAPERDTEHEGQSRRRVTSRSGEEESYFFKLKYGYMQEKERKRNRSSL